MNDQTVARIQHLLRIGQLKREDVFSLRTASDEDIRKLLNTYTGDPSRRVDLPEDDHLPKKVHVSLAQLQGAEPAACICGLSYNQLGECLSFYLEGQLPYSAWQGPPAKLPALRLLRAVSRRWRCMCGPHDPADVWCMVARHMYGLEELPCGLRWGEGALRFHCEEQVRHNGQDAIIHLEPEPGDGRYHITILRDAQDPNDLQRFRSPASVWSFNCRPAKVPRDSTIVSEAHELMPASPWVKICTVLSSPLLASAEASDGSEGRGGMLYGRKALPGDIYFRASEYESRESEFDSEIRRIRDELGVNLTHALMKEDMRGVTVALQGLKLNSQEREDLNALQRSWAAERRRKERVRREEDELLARGQAVLATIRGELDQEWERWRGWVDAETSGPRLELAVPRQIVAALWRICHQMDELKTSQSPSPTKGTMHHLTTCHDHAILIAHAWAALKEEKRALRQSVLEPLLSLSERWIASVEVLDSPSTSIADIKKQLEEQGVGGHAYPPHGYAGVLNKAGLVKMLCRVKHR